MGEDLGVKGGWVYVGCQLSRLLQETEACGSIAGGEEPHYTGEDLLLVFSLSQQLANLWGVKAR